jgi:hypothetical protein
MIDAFIRSGKKGARHSPVGVAQKHGGLSGPPPSGLWLKGHKAKKKGR